MSDNVERCRSCGHVLVVGGECARGVCDASIADRLREEVIAARRLLQESTAFLGEVATALGIDAKNDPWRVIEYARRLRAAAAEEACAARAHGAAVNAGTHEEEMAASTAAANALAALEDVLRG